MGFLRFKDFIEDKNTVNVEENLNNDFYFEISDAYIGGNREEVDTLLYEYLCNYKDDKVFDELSIEELWSYIKDDEELSEDMKNELGRYIDLCEESIKDILEIED